MIWPRPPSSELVDIRFEHESVWPQDIFPFSHAVLILYHTKRSYKFHCCRPFLQYKISLNIREAFARTWKHFGGLKIFFVMIRLNLNSLDFFFSLYHFLGAPHLPFSSSLCHLDPFYPSLFTFSLLTIKSPLQDWDSMNLLFRETSLGVDSALRYVNTWSSQQFDTPHLMN